MEVDEQFFGSLQEIPNSLVLLNGDKATVNITENFSMFHRFKSVISLVAFFCRFLFSSHFHFFLFSLPFASVPAGATIGFDRNLYTVGESDGYLTVCVALMSGTLLKDARVLLFEQKVTAIGTYILHTYSEIQTP